MKNPKELILPLLVVVTLTVVATWILYNFLGKFIFYEKLHRGGVETNAVLLDKGIFRNGRLFKTSVTSASNDHRFVVAFATEEGVTGKCTISVSKRTYDVISKRDELLISYLPEDPAQCTIPNSFELNRYLVITVLAVAVFLLLLAAGFVLYIYKSFKKPSSRHLVPLTNNLDLPGDGLTCPKCGSGMTEGYLPAVGGVSWRDRDDPVGIPTMLTGLPGTTFWLKRPKLHAYHCESCHIITFRYGSQ
ncbi:MAG: PF20097 family protein [Deltaproteobacteria bacterium]